ncbi:MAG: N-acetylmuramoyl-L-alanine amidase [Desulfobacter sp.]|nr:MAG: N-acetylmuramoyl-L-alanine amidase [Desulfobacter sp.]
MTKERFLALSTLVIFTLLCTVSGHAANIKTRQKTIILDPGHGGSDTGLTTPAGVKEKDITLELARLTAAELSDFFTVKLTRDRTASVQSSPGQRAAFANQNHADLFISIHLHHAGPDTAFIYYYDHPGTPAPDQWEARAITARPRSQKLAKTLAAHLQAGSPPLQTTLFNAPLVSLEGVAAPAILIEPVSITQIPVTGETRKKFLQPYARTIADSLRNFLKKQN